MGLETLVIIVAGGEGARLWPLTDNRSKPAVPIGGKYRLIDIPLSNALNSELTRILVLPQGKYYSLQDHIKDTWNSDQKRQTFVKVIPPQGRGEIYAGSADAVRQVEPRIIKYNPKKVLIVPGDHLLKMNYQNLIHRVDNPLVDAAVALMPKPLEQSKDLGSIGIDDNKKITKFLEKVPNTPLRVPGNPDQFYASMGIYAFKTEKLFEAIKEGNDFGSDVLPRIIESMNIQGYDYSAENKIPGIDICEKGNLLMEVETNRTTDSDYWRDVGTIEQYFEANMDLVGAKPVFDLYNSNWPFYTYHDELGPGKVDIVPNTIVGSGSILSNIQGKNLVISPDVKIYNSKLEEVIVFSRTRIQRANLRRTIVDKDVIIRPESDSEIRIGFDEKEDMERGIYVDKSGIRVVPKEWKSYDPSTWVLKDEIKRRYTENKA